MASSNQSRPLFPAMKLFSEPEPEPAAAAAKTSNRGRKPSAKKGEKKIPQRGMGVEQLEKLRVQEAMAQATQMGSPTPTFHDHHHHHHQYPLTSVFGGGGSSTVPFSYGGGAPSPNYGGYGGFLQYQQPMIYGGNMNINNNNNNNNNNTFGVMGHQGRNFNGGGGVVAANANGSSGWYVPDHQIHRVGNYGSGTPFRGGPLLGTPLETSRELSSMPNLHSSAAGSGSGSGSQPYGFGSFKSQENVFNEQNVRGSNVWRDRPLSQTRFNVENRSIYHTDECAEVIAVHRKGFSEVFMEYEFFPGRSTVPKELEFPRIGSGSVGGGEAASSITTVADYGDTASNAIDLSLKLYH